ncbi:MAG: Mur ligase family protein [Bacteroidota bacterium]
MKVHFIAIGGSAMHNLAIDLHNMGIEVTGSDDEIFEPSKTRLEAKGLLPDRVGWNPDSITKDLDAIILGMHARADNPELMKALELGIKVYSYPEYIYEQSKAKKRIVIGGSHGKTTITAMIMHVYKKLGMDFDYMVGAQLEGFETMVKITANAPIILLEGDEYLASPLDRRPKFHLYHANIALISGIAWDHINVFPTFDNYLEQFRIFVNQLEDGSPLVYNETDREVKKIAENAANRLKLYPYSIPKHTIEAGITHIFHDSQKIPLVIFGEHNLMNLEGAKIICKLSGIDEADFYAAIQSFKGAAKRLQLIGKNAETAVYKDFAHSPSKLKATTAAVKNQYPDRTLVACMELHTFSSLNKEFLKGYFGSMELADEAIVYFNPHTIEHKKLAPISVEEVMESFGGNNISVYTDAQILQHHLLNEDWKQKNLLLMSSGNFDGMNMEEFAAKIIASTVG